MAEKVISGASEYAESGKYQEKCPIFHFGQYIDPWRGISDVSIKKIGFLGLPGRHRHCNCYATGGLWPGKPDEHWLDC